MVRLFSVAVAPLHQTAMATHTRCRGRLHPRGPPYYEASGSDGFNLSGSRGAHRPPLQSRQLHISIIRNSDGGRTVPPLHSMPTFIASKTSLLPAYQFSTPPRTDPSLTQLTTDARLHVLCRHRLTPPLRQPSSLLSPPPQRLLHSTNWWARQKLTGMTLLRSWSGLGNDGGRANMRSRGLHFRVPNRYGRILRNC
jgi:hypothetical protein